MSNKDEKLYVGVDIGKTKIAAGLVSDSGMLHIRLEEASTGCNAEEIISKCNNMVRSIFRQSSGPICGIGIGASGVIDSANGVIVSSGAIPGWKNIKICKILESEFRVETRIDNDVNVAAICEHRFGAGENVDSSVYISVGTGVGLCSILNGKVHRGRHNISGQIAYLKLFDCDYTVNEICSGRGIAGRASKSRTFTTNEVFQMAGKGIEEAKETIDDAEKALAMIAMWIQNTIDPDVIIFGGGVIARNDDFFESIKSKAQSNYFSNYIDALGGPINMKKAKFGMDAGIIGAGCLCF